ncbi:5624_t:CDS:2 [Entrophospora sp. SA101]|nr:5624_t:CDS:2 [Entrophospora sp. SA101]
MIDNKDKSHIQLFYDITKVKTSSDLKDCKPSYCREVLRPHPKYKLYWYNSALKSVQQAKQSTNNNNSEKYDYEQENSSVPTTIWSIDQLDKLKHSKIFRKVKRPKSFIITCAKTNSSVHFKYKKTKDKKPSKNKNNSKPSGYSADVEVPFDNTCIQQYIWLKSTNGSKWVLFAKNNPKIALVEFRKTACGNEFDVAFMVKPPNGWDPKFAFDRFNKCSFPYDETPRDSNLIYNAINIGNIVKSMNNMKNGDGHSYENYDNSGVNGDGDDKNDDDGSKYWLEFVLASTVTIQDEVNSNKKKLWMNTK